MIERLNLYQSLILTAVFCLFANFFALAQGAEPDLAKLISESQVLLKSVKPANTSYKHKDNQVSWGGNEPPVCHADCSGLMNALLLHCQIFSENDFLTYLGSKRPLAKHYHDAIIHQRGFKEITSVEEFRAGDIIAIKYPPGSENSGHIMLILSAPNKRKATEPIVKNTTQYEIEILDSSQSGHGLDDSRKLDSGKYHDGLGKGIYRLFSNANGLVIGHTWSVQSNSKYYEMNVRHLVVGRLTK